MYTVTADGIGDTAQHCAATKIEIAIASKGRHHRRIGIDEHMTAIRREAPHAIAARGSDQISAQHQIRAAISDASAAQPRCIVSNLDVRPHRTILLREAGLIEHTQVSSFEMRGHAENIADGHYTRAADPRHQDVVAAMVGKCRRALRFRQQDIVDARRLRHAQLTAFDSDKTRAQAIQATEVFIAGRLVDAALTTEPGFEWTDGKTVGLRAAIAAALTHQFVDHYPPTGLRHASTLSAPTFLRRAGLCVNEQRDPRQLAQFTLHGIEFGAITHRHASSQGAAIGITRDIIGDHGNALHAFAMHLMRDHRDRRLTLDRLAAGHRHRVVIQKLIGDVDASDHRCADRQRSGVGVGAIADIDEYMSGIGKWRLPQPARAFTTLVREGGGVPVHPLRHEVATDSGQCATPGRHLGGGVMRAAGSTVATSPLSNQPSAPWASD